MAIDLGRWKPELHPRDSKGRFRDAWGLNEKARAAVDQLLANFTHTPNLRSNEHAASYLRQQAPKRSERQKEVLRKFLTREGNENIQSTLRAGDQPTPDIKELDAMMVPLEHDLVLSRVVGPDAFGLRADQIDGVEDWNGQRFQDPGYAPHNIGDAYQVAGPHVEMRTLVPKGTPAIIVGGDGNSGDDARTVILPRELTMQNIKIQSDGRGGWYAMSVVAPQQSGGRPAQGLAGRPLSARDKSPAIEATPDELQRRGLPEEAGVPATQEQPGRLGPTSPSPGAGQQVLPQAQQVQSIPNPAAAGRVAEGGPPGDVVQPAKAVKKAGGRVSLGEGQVVGEGTDVTPPEKITPRKSIQAIPEEQARIQEAQRRADEATKAADARQARLDAAEKVLAEREARASEERARASEAQAKTIEQQQQLIDRLLPAQGVAQGAQPPGEGSQGGTSIAGLSEGQKDNVLRRLRPEGTTDEDRRQQGLARAIRAERGLPADGSGDNVQPAKKAAKAIKAPAKKAAVAAAPSDESDLTPEQRAELQDVANTDELRAVYRQQREAGQTHTRALLNTQEAKSRGAIGAAKKTAVAKRAAPSRPNHIGNQIRGSEFQDLRPGDVVEIPPRNGRPARRATVDFLGDNGAVHLTDNSTITPEGGAVKVISQGNLRPSKAAQARAKKAAGRAAAGLGVNEAIRAGRTGKITPEQAAKNLDNKVADLRKLQVQLGDQAPPELPQVIDGLEAEARRLRGEGPPNPEVAQKTTAAVKRGAKKIGLERSARGEEGPLEVARPAKATPATKSIKKTAQVVGPKLVDADRPDAANVNELRQAKTLADINAVAAKHGIRIPSTVGRREDRRQFLENALSMRDGESKADYDARIAELGTPPARPGRGRPRKIVAPAAPEAGAPAAAPAKKATRLAKKAAPEAPVKKTTAPAKKAPASAKDVLDERAVGSTVARNNIKDARRDLDRGESPADVAETLRGKAAELQDGEPLTSDDMPDRLHHSDEDMRDIQHADARALDRMADELEKAAPAKKVTKAAPAKAPAKSIKKAAPAKPTITRRSAVSKMEDREILAEAAGIEGTPQTPRERAVQRAADRINVRQAREQATAAKKAAGPVKKVTKVAPAKAVKKAPTKASTIDKRNPAESPVELKPKPVKVTKTAEEVAASKPALKPRFTARTSKEYRPTKLVKTARLVDKKPDGSPLGPDDETTIVPEWGGEQKFRGPYMEVLGGDGKPAYGSALDEWNQNNERVRGTKDGWVKVTPVTAHRHVGDPRVVETVLKDGTKETKNIANPGDWIVRQPNGEVQVINDAEFRKRYQTRAPQSVGTHAARLRVQAKDARAKEVAAKKAAAAAPKKTAVKATKAAAPERPVKVTRKSARKVGAPPEERASRRIGPIKEAPSADYNPSAWMIQRGDRIMVTQNAEGQWIRAMNKRGAVPLTVDRVERAQAGRQSGYVFHGKTDDGRDVSIGPVFGQNVFKRAPEKAVPAKVPAAKKVAATKAPAKVTLKRKGPGTRPALNDEQIREAMTPRMKQQFEGLDEAATSKYMESRRSGESHTTALREAKKAAAPTAKNAPVKAIKKAAPEKPTVTRRPPPITTMADKAVLDEAAKIEGEPSTPRERAIARKAAVINAREERANARAAKVLAPSTKAAKVAKVAKAAAPEKKATSTKAPARAIKKAAPTKAAASGQPKLSQAEVIELQNMDSMPHNSDWSLPTNAAALRRMEGLVEKGYLQYLGGGKIQMTPAGRDRARSEPLHPKSWEAEGRVPANPARKQTASEEVPATKAAPVPERPVKVTRAAKKSTAFREPPAKAAEPAAPEAPAKKTTGMIRTPRPGEQQGAVPALREATPQQRKALLAKVRRAGSDADAEEVLRDEVNADVMREIAADNNIDTAQKTIPAIRKELARKMRSVPDFKALRRGPAAGEEAAPTPRKRALRPETPSADAAVRAVMNRLSPEARQSVLESMTPEQRQAVQDAIGRVDERLAARKAARVAKAVVPEVSAAKTAKKAVRKAEAPAPAKVARKAVARAIPEAPAKKAARPLIKRQGKAVTSAEARRESALESVRAHDMGNDVGIMGEYRVIERNLQSGDFTPAQAKTHARREAQKWRRDARTVRANKQLPDRDRDKTNARMLDAGERYDKLADAIDASQTRDRIEAKRFGEAPTPAPSKRASKKAAAAEQERMNRSMEVLSRGGHRETPTSTTPAPTKATKKAPAPTTKSVKAAPPAKKVAAKVTPQKSAKKAAVAKKAPRLGNIPEGVGPIDRIDDIESKLTPDEVAEVRDLNPEQARKYWSSRVRGIGHDTAMRGVPRGDQLEGLRRTTIPAGEEGTRAPGAGGIEALRRPSAQFERPTVTRAGSQRHTEAEKDAILKQVRDAKAANPNWPVTREDRDLQREAEGIEVGRAATAKAAKAPARSRVTGEEIKPKKVSPAAAKARQIRADRYDAAVGDIEGPEGKVLRDAKHDLAGGESATSVKQRLTARAETLRDMARIQRESGNEEVLPGEAARLDRLAERYEKAADLAGKRIPAVKNDIARGAKVPVKDLTDGDVAILHGREGIFRQPSPRKAFIEFPDGSQEPVRKTRLAQMVRDKDLQLLGGKHRPETVEGKPAKAAKKAAKAARPERPVKVTKAAPRKVGLKKAAKAAEPEAVPAKKVTKRATKAAKAVEAAPEKPVIKRAAKKAPAEKSEKFLPPLADGTRRKSATNLKPGDVVRRPGNGKYVHPAREVDTVEQGGGRLRVTFKDGTVEGPNPNSAYWMSDTPAERASRRLRGPVGEEGNVDTSLESRRARKAVAAPRTEAPQAGTAAKVVPFKKTATKKAPQISAPGGIGDETAIGMPPTLGAERPVKVTRRAKKVTAEVPAKKATKTAPPEIGGPSPRELREAARREARDAREAAAAERASERNKKYGPDGPSHIDLKKVGEGLDMRGEEGVDRAQADLNDGKTPAEVAKKLDFIAQGIKNSAAIRYGGWDSKANQDRLIDDPEYYGPHIEKMRQDYESWTARGDKYEELARRLRGTRRPVARKAVAARKAPAKVIKKAVPAVSKMTDDEVVQEATKLSGPPQTARDRAILRRASLVERRRQRELTRKRQEGTATQAEAPMKVFAEPAKKAAAPEGPLHERADIKAVSNRLPENEQDFVRRTLSGDYGVAQRRNSQAAALRRQASFKRDHAESAYRANPNLLRVQEERVRANAIADHYDRIADLIYPKPGTKPSRRKLPDVQQTLSSEVHDAVKIMGNSPAERPVREALDSGDNSNVVSLRERAASLRKEASRMHATGRLRRRSKDEKEREQGLREIEGAKEIQKAADVFDRRADSIPKDLAEKQSAVEARRVSAAEAREQARRDRRREQGIKAGLSKAEADEFADSHSTIGQFRRARVTKAAPAKKAVPAKKAPAKAIKKAAPKGTIGGELIPESVALSENARAQRAGQAVRKLEPQLSERQRGQLLKALESHGDDGFHKAEVDYWNHRADGDSHTAALRKVAQGKPTITRKAAKAAAPEAPPAKKATRAVKAVPEKKAPAKKVVVAQTATKKAAPETEAQRIERVRAVTDVAKKKAAATTARDRLDVRQKTARIEKAKGSVDLADSLLRAADAFRRGDNPDGFMRAARQDIEGKTPGDLTNKRDAHAAGWEALKKAMGPERNWNTPDKLEDRLRAALKDMGINVDHKHGEGVKFDPDTMKGFDGASFNRGDEVTIVRPALSYTDKDGTVHLLRPATVTRRRRGGDTDTGPLSLGPRGGPFGDVELPPLREGLGNEGIQLLRDMRGSLGPDDPNNPFRSARGLDRADTRTRAMKTSELRSMAQYLGVRLTPGQKQDSIRHDVMRDLRRRLGVPEPRDQKERERLERLSVRELIEGAPEGTRFPSAASKQDLVEIRLGDGPVEDFHAGPMQPRSQAVKDAFDSGTTDRKYFSGGSMGQVAHVDTGNGKQLIRKRMADDWFAPAKQSIDAEQLISELGERVDAPQAAGYRPGEKVFYGEYIPGPMAFSHGDEAITAAVATPKGRRIAILDAITGNSDRHNNNFKIIDGEPIGFDNSLAFDRDGRGLDFGPAGEILPGNVHSEDPFEQHYPYRTKTLDTTSFPGITLVRGGHWLDQHPFPKEELLDFRRELDAMKPQFEKLDRQDWWDQTSQRLDALIKRARTAKQLGITLPPKERASIRATERTRIPDIPEPARRVPDVSDVTPTILTGRQGLDTSDMGPPGDTGPDGIPAKDFTLRSGYHIAHGTFFRQDRIPYLIEHEDTPEGKAQAQRIKDALRTHRQSLPLSQRRLQRSYTWARGENPKDIEAARRLGVDPEEWKSEAVSDSLGGVTLYNRDSFGSDGVDQVLDHEFAHTLDHVGKEMGGIGSGSPRWHAAAKSDARHRQGLSDVTFDQGPGEQSRIRLKDVKPNPGIYNFLEGVTDYGSTDDGEDYAESFRLYRAGIIGKGRRTPGGPIEPLWFRDVFPERAAILDQAVPDFAEKQLREIAQARGTELTAAKRRELIKRLIRQRDNSDRSVAFRDLAKTAPRERHSIRTTRTPEEREEIERLIRGESTDATPNAGVRGGVLTGRVGISDDVHRILTEDTGPSGVPVRDLELQNLHGYKIGSGRAWRFGGVTYLLEDGSSDRNARWLMDTIYGEQQQLPAQMKRYQRGFVLLQNDEPGDAYQDAKARIEARRRGLPPPPPSTMRTQAAALGGDVYVFRLRHDDPNSSFTVRRLTHGIRHESSHNVDKGIQINGQDVSSSPVWLKASQGKPAHKPYRLELNSNAPLSPIMFDNDPSSPFVGGVTRYGTTSPSEDFAESLAMYQAGVIGRGRMTRAEPERDIYFRDLFPERARVLDALFPDFARDQLAQIAAS